jgi:hypothetical protein
MKNLILKISLLTTLTLTLFACPSDDDASSNDIIIGTWRAIERYESNELVDMPTCLPHLYAEYRSDRSMGGGKIITDAFPEECGLILFELGWSWENLGDSQYRLKPIDGEGNVFRFYKEGDNLVQENLDGIIKTIYEPYNE